MGRRSFAIQLGLAASLAAFCNCACPKLRPPEHVADRTTRSSVPVTTQPAEAAPVAVDPLEALVQQALGKNRERQFDALIALAYNKDAASTAPRLAPLLESEDPGVRDHVYLALKMMGPRGTQVAIDALKSKNVRARRFAAEILADTEMKYTDEWQHQRMVMELFKLIHGPDVETDRIAARTLCKLGPDSWPVLLHVIRATVRHRHQRSDRRIAGRPARFVHDSQHFGLRSTAEREGGI